MFDENSNQKNGDNRGSDKKQAPGMKFSPLTWVAWIAILGVMVALFYVNSSMKKTALELSQPEFLQKFDSNEVALATININPQTAPMVQISGTFYAIDKDG